jgi:hypothetical protein
MKWDEIFEAVRAYHGSGHANPVFIMGHTGNNSHTFGSYQSQRWGVFFTDNPDFARMYGNVAAYDLDLHKTLDCENDNNAIWNFVQSFDPHDPEQRNTWLDARAIMHSNHYWQLFEDEVGERFVAYLRELGFDSAMFVEYNVDDNDGDERRSHTIVVLDPSLIHKD